MAELLIKSPLEGKVIAIENVSDPVFAQKMMGEGVAIEPTNGEVVAPISGTLTTVFPTGHAYGITGDNGEEVLVHIGLNTVELNGQGFDIKVSADSKINVGDVMCIVDLDFIKSKGLPIVTPIIITNTAEFSSVVPTTQDSVVKEDVILTLTK